MRCTFLIKHKPQQMLNPYTKTDTRLVEEMSRTNASLRREARILSLLPDMIFAVSPSTGAISFHNAQANRVLGHNSLVGGGFYTLLCPPSRPLIRRLVGEGDSTQSGAVVSAVSSSQSGATSSSSLDRPPSASATPPSSTSSSSSSYAPPHRDANALSRNVAACNAKMDKGAGGLRDDVNGDNVTANNANAR